MEKRTTYPRVRFGTDVIADALREFEDNLPEGERPSKPSELTVVVGNESWGFDSSTEFLAAHRKSHSSATVNVWGQGTGHNVCVMEFPASTFVAITGPDRGVIEHISSIFDRRKAEFYTAAPKTPKVAPKVFIGHGRSSQWRDLKDHLQDIHGYDVVAYETGSRAGHTIRDILADMLASSSFAVLVMTGEDVTAQGGLRARQNVIHETGLFQGRLGFERAIVLLEEGAEDYSNLQGIHQLRYTKDNIKEMYGDVLGALRREFPPD